jgi:hypothetical protein
VRPEAPSSGSVVATHEEEIGNRSVRHKCLRAVEDVAPINGPRGRAKREHVGAGLRLGDRVRADDGPVDESREVPRALLIRAGEQDRQLHAPELRHEREQQTVVAAAAAEPGEHVDDGRQLLLGATYSAAIGSPRTPNSAQRLQRSRSKKPSRSRSWRPSFRDAPNSCAARSSWPASLRCTFTGGPWKAPGVVERRLVRDDVRCADRARDLPVTGLKLTTTRAIELARFRITSFVLRCVPLRLAHRVGRWHGRRTYRRRRASLEPRAAEIAQRLAASPEPVDG